jgi:hypothetical protein
MLYRVFPWRPGTDPRPLDVPRDRQGRGRHDSPDDYTALYLARDPVAAIAERIQGFRGQTLTPGVFERADGRADALAELDDEGLATAGRLVDLDDPAELLAAGLRPSRVATGDRPTTQAIARRYFADGAVGLSWWSTLEAAWTNVTLYAERAAAALEVVDVRLLGPFDPSVVAAADRLGVGLPRRRGRLRLLQ